MHITWITSTLGSIIYKSIKYPKEDFSESIFNLFHMLGIFIYETKDQEEYWEKYIISVNMSRKEFLKKYKTEEDYIMYFMFGKDEEETIEE